MFFRAILLSLIALSMGCGIRFDPARGSRTQGLPMDSGAQTGSSSSGCLTGAAEQLSRFWNGKAHAPEIEKLWNCASDSLDLFLTRARGSKLGIYSAKELRSFLQTYFLQDFIISDELLTEAMALKQLFIGGSRTAVTVQDIKKTKRLIETIKRTSIDLIPHMPLPFVRAEGEVTEERVFQIIRAIQLGGASLLASLEQSNADYTLGRLYALTEQLSLMPRTGPDEESAVLWIKEKLPLVRALKVGLLGGKGNLEESVLSSQWAHFIRTGIEGYALYLRFLYLTEQFRMREYPVGYVGSTRERFVNWASDVLSFLESAASKRADRVIPYLSIDEAIKQYPWKKAHGLEPGAIGRLIRAANERMLRSGSTLGISVAALQNLRGILYDWSTGQQYLEGNFGVKESDFDYPASGSADRFRIGGMMRLPGIGGSFSGTVSPTKPTDLNEILFLRPRPVFAENTSELTFPGPKSNFEHTFSEMSQLNWMIQLGRLLVSSYGESAATGTRLKGLRQIYEDLREVGIQARIFDPVDDKVPEKRFREANLFLPSSDGNAWLSRKEGTELVAYLVSTKVIMARIHKDLISPAKCGRSRDEDIYGWALIQADCFRKHFYSNFKLYFPNWPLLNKFVDDLSRPEQPATARPAYFASLEVASRKGQPTAMDPINSSDLEGFVAVLQYVETVFHRFDRNDDGYLDDVESDAAFPVFRSTLKEVFAKANPKFNADDNDLRSALKFLLINGRAPTSGEFGVFRYLTGRFGKVQATRATLVGIFAEVSSGL